MNKEVSVKLKEKIIPIYKELFENNNFENVCTFAIQWGKNFPMKRNEGFLFVGKAVNGWVTDDKNIDNLFDINNTERIFERKDQMEWVHNLSGNTDGYNTRKSAFWRVIKKISKHYYPKKWYSHIAWTNLYKVAPWEGGNPNGKLKKQQEKYCYKLLQNEIKVLSPKYVIFFTSGWEWSFIEHLKKGKKLKTISVQKWDKYKTSLIEVDNVKLITSLHPQGKNECKHKETIIRLIDED